MLFYFVWEKRKENTVLLITITWILLCTGKHVPKIFVICCLISITTAVSLNNYLKGILH